VKKFRNNWTLHGPGPSMGQPPGVTGHYRVQAPPWVSPQGSLDTTGSRRLHGSAPGGHWTLPGSGPSLGQPPGEGRPPVHTTSCHVLFPGDALSHFLAKNASERGVVTGWPLVWKTWKCQGIWQLSGKCRGFHWKSGKCQGRNLVREKLPKTVIVNCIFASIQVFSTSTSMIWVTLNMPPSAANRQGIDREFHIVWREVTLSLVCCVTDWFLTINLGPAS